MKKSGELMARGGVTFTEVDEAARYLQGAGRNPTVDSIRERLGTGSRTTLAEHLKRWRSLQADGEGHLPQPLLALVAGLWEALQSTAEQRVQENQSIAHQEVATLKSHMQELQQTEQQLQQALHQLQEKFDAEQRSTSALTQQLNNSQIAYDKLNATDQILRQQIENTKAENQRLHQLTQQIQANLEHYQQAIEQQQLQKKLEQEKQQAITAHEISQLKATLEETNTRYYQSEKILAGKESAFQQMQEKHVQLTEQHQESIEIIEKMKRCNIQLETENDGYLKHIEKINAELSTTKALIQSQQEQIAVTNDQLKQAQSSRQQAENKIEQLRDEKLFLVQEKSNFEGALKQLRTDARV